ncbi:MAG: hypothetical protein Q8O07_05170 [Chloroflexota bacterium]|nr:hypothetical protein [Chloroflexota bacterium]
MNGHSPTLPVVHLPRWRPLRRLQAGVFARLADDNVHRAFRTGGLVMVAVCIILLLSYRQANPPAARRGSAAGPLAVLGQPPAAD